MKFGIYNILVLFLVTSCGNTKTYTVQEQQAYQNLQELVAAQNFEITSNFARPMATMAFMQVANTNILGPGNTANNIDIIANSNNLTIKGDSIRGYFPYFGEQRFGGGYPGQNHQGIEFTGVPDNYEMAFNDKKNIVTINFRIDDQYRTNERYNVFITLFPNLRSTIQINSTNRTSIEYTGRIQQLVEQKEEE